MDACFDNGYSMVSDEVNLQFTVWFLIVSVLTVALSLIYFQQFDYGRNVYAQSTATKVTNDKVVILNFDDGRKTQYTQAKPILDKYGVKSTFYVVCNYVGKPGYMNWDQIRQLNEEGHDIGSHSMNHADLSNLSKKVVKFEVDQSKKCLKNHGIDATSFAYPFNRGSDDKKVIKIVSKYYDLARTADSPITYLHCDGWKDQSNQKDCTTYTKKDDLNFANRYSIRGWSHDFTRKSNSYNDDDLFNKFIKVVNSQIDYNKEGIINAIPIIIYHRAGDKDAKDYNTDLKLFEKEMKYLHDNNFRVITMKDLGYQEKSNYLYIKSHNELSQIGGLASVSSSN